MESENNPSQQPKPESQPQPSTPNVPKSEPTPSGGQNEVTGVEPNKLMAAISYLGILVLVPLLVSRNDKFVMFHAKQGLVILVGYVVGSVAASWVPLIGNLLVLVMIIASIAGLIQALQGKWWKMPLVGDLAAKFKI